jgi:hypothetical protein
MADEEAKRNAWFHPPPEGKACTLEELREGLRKTMSGKWKQPSTSILKKKKSPKKSAPVPSANTQIDTKPPDDQTPKE